MKQMLFLLFLIVGISAVGQEDGEFELMKGDLLFQDLDCGPLCESIEKVTKGYRGANLSHVGIADKNENDEWIVIESISEKVDITPLNKFLYRSTDRKGDPKVLVGRLDKKYRDLVRKAIDAAYKLLGYSYDNVYDIQDSTYYCSELIYFAFKEASNGKPFFRLRPMTFKDPAINRTFPAWVDYFENRDSSIPEGEPGLNPGGISRSKKLEIVHFYGKPENFKPKN